MPPHSKSRKPPPAARVYRDYTPAELLADAVLHITGVSAALIAAPVLVIVAILIRGEDTAALVAAVIYGLCLIAMFSASAGYHLLGAGPRLRDILRRLDHAAIYAKIAGTYTPFTVLLGGERTALILAGMWSAAGAGIALRLFLPNRFEWFLLGLYLAMGWAIVVVGLPILGAMSTAGLVLMIIGGALYTLGVPFHLWESLPYQNAIWHAFVLAGSFVFYAAVVVEFVH